MTKLRICRSLSLSSAILYNQISCYEFFDVIICLKYVTLYILISYYTVTIILKYVVILFRIFCQNMLIYMNWILEY